MTEQEQLRRVRGRARRARRMRRNIRISCLSVLALFTFVIFSSTAFDFVKRERVRYLEPHRQSTYVLPQLPAVVAQAESKKIVFKLPRLLRIDELFPRYQNPKPVDPNEEGNDDGQEIQEELVVLDDLTAAPPKTIYLDAIFANGGLATREEAPPVELSQDFTGDGDPFRTIGGYGPGPVIPEPSTGLLLGLGLTGLAALSSRLRRLQISAIDRSTSPHPTKK